LLAVGPGRYTKAPCDIDAVEQVDAVIISHNHYDHLSYPTIMKIAEKHPNVQFFVPLGNKSWFINCGIHNVTELDWWEGRELRLSKVSDKNAQLAVEGTGNNNGTEADITAKIGCLPCQHTSSRGLFDRAQTLWASWSVESGGKKVWFAG
jgi:N-acyl-phosphatidylethanolamine-hydrolysing phospholipase D